MKNLILKPGSYELANGKQQPGGDLGRFILDYLTSKGVLTTTDCCTYTLVGGGGTVTTNNLTYTAATRTLTSTVEGIATSVVIPLATALAAGLMTATQFTTTQSLITASTVNQIPYAGAGSTYLSDPKFTWTPGTSTLLIDGKLSVTGLIDPTGVEFTQQATNPGLVPANTIWVSSTTGNLMVGDRNLETNKTEVISTTSTLSNTSRLVFASGTITLTLPAGVTGQVIDIKNVGTGTVTVSGNMDATTSFPLTSYVQTSAVSQGYACSTPGSWFLI